MLRDRKSPVQDQNGIVEILELVVGVSGWQDGLKEEGRADLLKCQQIPLRKDTKGLTVYDLSRRVLIRIQHGYSTVIFFASYSTQSSPPSFLFPFLQIAHMPYQTS